MPRSFLAICDSQVTSGGFSGLCWSRAPGEALLVLPMCWLVQPLGVSAFLGTSGPERSWHCGWGWPKRELKRQSLSQQWPPALGREFCSAAVSSSAVSTSSIVYCSPSGTVSIRKGFIGDISLLGCPERLCPSVSGTRTVGPVLQAGNKSPAWASLSAGSVPNLCECG